MLKRTIVATFIATVLASASFAAADHTDPNADSTRCDTWKRDGHTGGHNHDAGSDIALGDPAGTVIHAQSGHYVADNDHGYLEVVGGQSYRGPDPDDNDFPGQGGYVQGELDPAGGPGDVDFNAAFFGPNVDAPPTDGDVGGWAQESYLHLCVSAADTKVEQESREP